MARVGDFDLILKNQLKAIMSSFGWELKRMDKSLPLLHEIHLDDLSFFFWLTNRHAKQWWYKPTLEFRAEHRFLKKCCKPGMVAIDIGAHHGTQTIPMSMWAGVESRVYAFEANRWNAITLQANIALNGLEHCAGIYSAVGSEDGTIGIEGETVGNATEPAIPTPCCTLDLFCRQRDIAEVDFVKIDVEGFEKRVLEGARNLLSNAPHISLELHIDDLPKYGDNAKETLALIDWEPYEVTAMNRASSWYDITKLTSADDLPASGVMNLFFFNPNRRVVQRTRSNGRQLQNLTDRSQ